MRKVLGHSSSTLHSSSVFFRCHSQPSAKGIQIAFKVGFNLWVQLVDFFLTAIFLDTTFPLSPFPAARTTGSGYFFSILPRAPAATRRTYWFSSLRARVRGSTARGSPISPSARAATRRTLPLLSPSAWMRGSTARGSPMFPRT